MERNNWRELFVALKMLLIAGLRLLNLDKIFPGLKGKNL